MQKRSEITHFEKVSRIITYKIPDFFTRQSPNFELLAKELTYMSPRDKKDKKKIEHQLEYLHFITKILTTERNKFSESADLDSGKLVGQKIKNLVYMAGGLDKPKEIEYRYIQELMEIFHQMSLLGKKIFIVEEQLMNELILTDCSKVDASFLKLPFTTMCIHLPFNTHLKIQEATVRWVYLSEVKVKDMLGINKEDVDELDYEGRAFKVFYIGADESFFTIDFLFRDGQDIDVQIKDVIERKFMGSKQGKKENIDVFSFLTSLMLYIGSSDADKTEIRPKVMFPAKDSRLPMCSLGRNIKINRELTASLGEAGTERTIHAVKWTVRGHWRNQVHGFQNKERRKQWVRPYLKGRERDENINIKPTIYQVE